MSTPSKLLQPPKDKHKFKHRLLASLVQAASLYGHGGDHDRKRILQAFVYGRFKLEAISTAHVQAIIAINKGVIGKAASAEAGRERARKRAGECVQAAIVSAKRCREKDKVRMVKLLGMLDKVCLRESDQPW